MIQIVFKNLEASELARSAIVERISSALEKFPVLASSRLSFCVEMHNSPTKPGPDYFSTTLHIKNGPFNNIRLSKSSHSFYLALSELVESLHELLAREGARRRVLARRSVRRFWNESWADNSILEDNATLS